MAQNVAFDIFKYISLNVKIWTFIKNSLFLSRRPIDNKPA